ncbi:hypothetical protein [Pararhizobium sp.]|uniref:hypothetical protein n=1 Tax=Pararhizobium sp. TaxID=1977563 RepID=UPI00271A64A8|nr:hypothetical protein [Pararhizobium sp.]MDO9418451.1 hypothetical protein [Pararhizobium sp.]
MTGHVEIQEWRDIPHKNPHEEIVIRFLITYADARRSSVLNVAAEIFRAMIPLEKHLVEGLRFDHDTPFRAAFAGGRKVHGWLRWRTGLDVQYSQQIMGRVEMEETAEVNSWNYVGFMICFGSAHPGPPPKPPPPDDGELPLPGPLPIPDLAKGMTIADAHLEAGELFPFVYIRPWPKLANRLADQQFMTVPAAAAASPFYTSLKGVAPADKRGKAVAFINDTIAPAKSGTPAEPFVTPDTVLAPPFGSLLHFPHHLRQDCTYVGLDIWVVETFGSWETLADARQSVQAQAALVDIWNSVIALMTTLGYDHTWFSDLIRLLQATHLVDWVLAFRQAHPKKGDTHAPEPSNAALSRAVSAVWVLPDDIFPIDPPPAPVAPPAVQPYAVGAIRTVHYQPGHYVLGDVQRIETVTAGETRQEIRRNLHRVETVDDEQASHGSTVSSGRDTTTADLINQVQKTLSDRVSATTIDKYQTDYGQPTTNSMKVTGNWWVQEQPAGGYLKDISKFARDVIERSVKILHRESVLHRSGRIFEELETTQTRTLANAGSHGNLQTVFRWVNRTYHLQTRASEDRLVFEIFVDNPGTELVQAMSQYDRIELTPPVSPVSMGVSSYSNLSPEPVKQSSPPASVYYLDIFQAYGIPPDGDAPPAIKVLSTGLTSRNPVAETKLDVLDGYLPVAATASVSSFTTGSTAQVVIAGVPLTAAQPAGTTTTFKGDLSGISARYASRLWASILCSPPPPASSAKDDAPADGPAPAPDTSPAEGATEFTTYYAASIQVQCTRSAATLANWQMAAYQKIQAAYQAALADHQMAPDDQRRVLQAENPAFLTQIVQEQIVQSAIALFARATAALSGDTTGETVSRTFEPRYAQFLRQAFDWDGMAVELIRNPQGDPYLSEGQTSLTSLFSPSRYLRDLLRARQARLLLSVKPDAARMVLLAFRTGQIWPCAGDLAPCMREDMSAVDLLLEQPHPPPAPPHDSWTVTVPTAMIALSHDNPFT